MSEQKECFLISPIGDEGSDKRDRSNKVMEHIIEETVSEYNYSVTRADELEKVGSITNQVIQETINSDLVIADLTGHNPNVFYELAVRHATGKPYIQIIKSNESIPFDVSDFRTVRYGFDIKEAEKAKNKISGLLNTINNSNHTDFTNPISQASKIGLVADLDLKISQIENDMEKSDQQFISNQKPMPEFAEVIAQRVDLQEQKIERQTELLETLIEELRRGR